MCLSTVVRLVDGKPEEICHRVSSAQVADGKITFVDIMGVKTEFVGRIDSVDLVENKIYVSAS